MIFIVSFLLGAIPFAVVIGKVFYKVDVRQHGSGNPGATNTLRTLGTKAGLIVLLLDMLKGVAAVLLAMYFSTWPAITVIDRMTIAGALAIMGHIFSPFLGFKGGKGVATTVGVLVALHPVYGVIIILTFTAMLMMSKYVSLSSITAAFVYTLLVLFFHTQELIQVIFAIGITLLIVVKHKANIQRLINGTENRFALKKKV
jgi:glycerol-3-phosphate acyltransferase PlsY